MKYEITSYSICVPLTDSQWKKLCKREDHDWELIYDRLRPAGADNIDYNGHFGRNIFFSVEKLEDVDRVTEALLEFLDTPLKKLKQKL